MDSTQLHGITLQRTPALNGHRDAGEMAQWFCKVTLVPKALMSQVQSPAPSKSRAQSYSGVVLWYKWPQGKAPMGPSRNGGATGSTAPTPGVHGPQVPSPEPPLVHRSQGDRTPGWAFSLPGCANVPATGAQQAGLWGGGVLCPQHLASRTRPGTALKVWWKSFAPPRG